MLFQLTQNDKIMVYCNSGVTFVSVQKNNAQIPVSVTFDPPSPLPPGVTTFRCDFTLGRSDSVCSPSLPPANNVTGR